MTGWSTAGRRDTLFVSYSHDDAAWMQAFRVMLEPMLDAAGVDLWVDTDIRTGNEWRPEIEQAIARSAVALVLVSSRFLYSPYVRDHELPALRRHGVVLAPVLVGSCGWDRRADLEAVQWLHDPGRDGALDLVADRPGERDRRIWQACEQLLTLCPRRPPAARPSPVPHHGGPVADIPVGDRSAPLFDVPALPPVYVPRTEELAALVELLTHTGSGVVGVTGDASVGLHGQGGIGKTVLAAALAHDDAARRRFPDGIHWVTVGQAGDVVGAQLDLLRQVDSSAPPPPTAGEVERTLRAALADRRALLVVDDVWSDADAQAFRLTGARGRLLYTSRDRDVLASVGAHTFPVEVLGRAAARLLASTVLGHGRPLPASADRAIEQVGRVALAVGLLAAAVHGGRDWSDVAAELASAADVFGDHPYANTFKAMQIGVATLPADLRDALLSLAVFPPDSRTPLIAVTRYWEHTRGSTSADTAAVLRRLAAATLLSFDGREIEFHDLQHEYLLLHAPALARLHGDLLAAYRRLLPDRRDWSRLPVDEPYAWGRLVHHLRAAGARRELAGVVTHPVFLAHRLTAGLPVAENDLADAARVLPTDPVIAWWRAWLPRHADVVTPPASATTVRRRLEAVAPSMLAWLDADPARPAAVDPQQLRLVCPSPYLAVRAGLEPRPAQQLRTLPGHTGGVTAIIWSPDGGRLATTSGLGPAQVWDTGSGRAVTLQDSHDATFQLWSPDGSLLATTSGLQEKHDVRVWEPRTGRKLSLPDTHGTAVLAWSPDSTRLATTVSGYRDVERGQDVRVWDPVSGRAATLPDTHDEDVLAWSPDGTRLATAIHSRGAYHRGRAGDVRVWEPNAQRAVILPGTAGAYVLAWSPDGTRLATAGRDQDVGVWDPDAETTTFLPDTLTVTVLAWSPDGTRLATTGYAGSSSPQAVRVWDPDTRRAIMLPHSHDSDVLAWSPDSTRLATGGGYSGYDGHGREVRVWDPSTRQAVVLPGTRDTTTLVWSPDGTSLATGSRRGGQDVRVWDPTAWQAVALADTHGSDLLAWSPDGHRLATASPRSEEARVWDPAGQRNFRRSAASLVAWSADSSRLATTGGQGSGQDVEVWEPSTGQAVTLPGTRDARVLVWSPDASRLATGGGISGGDGQDVRVWDPGARQAVMLPGTDDAYALAWSPDGTRLAIAAFPGGRDVRVWDPSTGQGSTLPDTHDATVLAWSPDGTRLATGDSDGWEEVRVWDPRTGRVVSLTDTGGTEVLAWSPDGTRLATAGSLRHGQDVRVWNPRTGHAATLPDTHRRPDLTWSPDSTHLAVTGFDQWQDVEVWNPRTLGVVALPDTAGTQAMAWSPDSTRLATTDGVGGFVGEHVVRVWNPRTGQAVELPDTRGATLLAWSPDSTHLATTNTGGAVLVVDPRFPERSTRVVTGPVGHLGWSAALIVGEIAGRPVVLELTTAAEEAASGPDRPHGVREPGDVAGAEQGRLEQEPG